MDVLLPRDLIGAQLNKTSCRLKPWGRRRRSFYRRWRLWRRKLSPSFQMINTCLKMSKNVRTWYRNYSCCLSGKGFAITISIIALDELSNFYDTRRLIKLYSNNKHTSISKLSKYYLKESRVQYIVYIYGKLTLKFTSANLNYKFLHHYPGAFRYYWKRYCCYYSWSWFSIRLNMENQMILSKVESKTTTSSQKSCKFTWLLSLLSKTPIIFYLRMTIWIVIRITSISNRTKPLLSPKVRRKSTEATATKPYHPYPHQSTPTITH